MKKETGMLMVFVFIFGCGKSELSLPGSMSESEIKVLTEIFSDPLVTSELQTWRNEIEANSKSIPNKGIQYTGVIYNLNDKVTDAFSVDNSFAHGIDMVCQVSSVDIPKSIRDKLEHAWQRGEIQLRRPALHAQLSNPTTKCIQIEFPRFYVNVAESEGRLNASIEEVSKSPDFSFRYKEEKILIYTMSP